MSEFAKHEGRCRIHDEFCDDCIAATLKERDALLLQIDALKKEEQDTRNQYTALKHSAASRISELEEDLGRANGNVSLLLGKLRNQLDGIVKDWGEAFSKYGFILHPGLTPEQNAAEWAAKVQEKDRLYGEMKAKKDDLMDAMQAIVDSQSVPPAFRDMAQRALNRNAEVVIVLKRVVRGPILMPEEIAQYPEEWIVLSSGEPLKMLGHGKTPELAIVSAGVDRTNPVGWALWYHDGLTGVRI